MENHCKGFISPLLFVIVILITGGGIYLWSQNKSTPPYTSTINSTPTPTPTPIYTSTINSTPTPSVTPTPTPTYKPPLIVGGRQMFALAQMGDSKISSLLSNPEVDGISLQAGWMNIEQGNNNFVWNDLDAALKIAKEHGKEVTLRPLEVFKGNSTLLSWLKSQGMKTTIATNGIGVTNELAVPWDEVFLSQYIEFINALAVHIKDKGYSETLSRIQVSAPVNEMNIPNCNNNSIGGVYAYDREKYLSAWKRVIDAFAVAFPDKVKQISSTSGQICRPQKDSGFFSDVFSYATKTYGDSFVPSANDLMISGSGRMSTTLDLAKNNVAYQLLWFSTNASNNRLGGNYPDNLLQSVCKGIEQEGNYFEIYSVDILNTNPTIQKAIKAVHDSSLCK